MAPYPRVRRPQRARISSALRAAVLALGIGFATLTIPQLLDTANAETPDATPTSAASTADAARATAAARPAGPKARVTRAGRAAAPAATSALPPSAPTPSSTPASTRTPLPATPRYRMLDTPASAAPRPGPQLLSKVLGTYVYFYNRTDQMLAVVQVPKGGRNDPEADPRFLAPGEKSDFYGDNSGDGNMDVRLRIYSATDDGTGAWRKDEMREIIAATNRIIGTPYASVSLDPYVGGYQRYYNRYGDKSLDIDQNWFADYNLRGPIQSGQTGTFIVRLGDRKGEFKVFQIEVFKIPQGATQDYPVQKSGRAM